MHLLPDLRPRCPKMHLLARMPLRASQKRWGRSVGSYILRLLVSARHLRTPPPRVPQTQKKTDAGESRNGCGRIPQRSLMRDPQRVWPAAIVLVL